MKRSVPSRRSGVTLIEVVIAASLLAVILPKAYLVVSATQEMTRQETSSISLEDHAREVMDRMQLAIMSCDRESLTPVLTPDYSTGVAYRFSTGVENGAVVWSDPEEISINGAQAQELRWRRQPGTPDEISVTWSRYLQPLFLGEEVNNLDDNGNGLVDEEGLLFSIDGDEVTIRLSLGRVMQDGEPVERALERVVACRNNPQGP